MTLDGMPPRKLFASEGMDSLFRRVEQTWRTGSKVSASLLEELIEAMKVLGCPEWLSAPVRQAFAGDPAAQALIAAMGEWEAAWFAQAGAEPNWFMRMLEQGTEVAVAGREVDRLAALQEFDRVPELVRSNPVLAPYLSRTALGHLRGDVPREAQVCVMWAGMCEFLLSQMARVDADPSIGPDAERGRRFVEMVTDRAGQRCLLSRGFVEWMMRQYGARSLTELWDLGRGKSDVGKISYKSLQGWHSGATAPNRAAAERFTRAIVRARISHDDDLRREWKLFDLQAWAARRLEAVLRLVEYGAGCGTRDGVPGLLEVLEASTPDEWCRRRYAFWLDHWGKSRGQATT